MRFSREYIPSDIGDSNPTKSEFEAQSRQRPMAQKPLPRLAFVGLAAVGSVMAQENRPAQNPSTSANQEQAQKVEKISYAEIEGQRAKIDSQLAEARRLLDEVNSQNDQTKKANEGYKPSTAVDEAKKVGMPENLPTDKASAIQKLRDAVRQFEELEKKLLAELADFKKSLPKDNNEVRTLLGILMSASESFDQISGFIKNSGEFKKMPADKQKELADWLEQFKQQLNTLSEGYNKYRSGDRRAVYDRSVDIQTQLLDATQKVQSLIGEARDKIVDLEK